MGGLTGRRGRRGCPRARPAGALPALRPRPPPSPEPYSSPTLVYSCLLPPYSRLLPPYSLTHPTPLCRPDSPPVLDGRMCIKPALSGWNRCDIVVLSE